MQSLIALAVALGVGHAAPSAQVSGAGIRPALDPVSDKKFMKQDYPDDLRPGLQHFKRYDWDHPYPIVQEDKQYDTDYVKDENNDNGEWKAQHEYDTLRSKIAKTKATVDDLKRRIEAMGGDIDAIEAEEARAEKLARDAEREADGDKAGADNAKGNAAKIAGEEGGAANGVKQEMDDLSICEKELRKIEQQLKDLLAQKDSRSSSADEAELALKKAAMEAELKQMSEAELEAKLEEEKQEYLRAKKRYEQSLVDMKDTQDSLDKAAEKLRKFRAKQDKGGGVYPVAFHSGAQRTFVLPAVMVMLLKLTL